MKTIHPAIAEHVMEENEKLRGLLRLATDRWESWASEIIHTTPEYESELSEIARVRAALSQQAEPVRSPGTEDTASMDSNSEQEQFTAVDMATAAAQGLRDGQAAVEPAPAQDEREAEAAVKALLFSGRLVDSFLIRDICKAVLAARPAQTEQQPVSWQFYQDGKWWNGDDRIKDHRKNTEAAGIPVRDLYDAPAAPIAQTAPQPEQSGLVEAITPEVIDWVRCGLSVNGRLVDGSHPALEKLCAAYRAALSAQGASK